MKSLPFLLMGVSLLLSGCPSQAAPDKVVVNVNGATILENQVIGEIDSRINAQAARDATRGLTFEESSREATRAYMRDDVLQMMIERLLIADQLKADKLEITDADVDARFLKEVNERNQTIEQAAQVITEEGLTIKEVKEGLWQTMGVERLYAAHAKDKKVMTEAEALQFYSQNPHYFEQKEERRVSRILIRLAPNADAPAKTAAGARAAKLLIRVKAGEDFAALAKAYSEDNSSKSRGGDRGWSPRGWITSTNSDPFGNVAFAMTNIDDISGVVETQDGYDIIKLTGLKPARMQSFDEVKGQIIGNFRYREIGGFWNQYSAQLWKGAKIEWSPEEKLRKARKEKEDREFEQKMQEKIAREKNKAGTPVNLQYPPAPPR